MFKSIAFATLFSAVMAAPAAELIERACKTEYLPTLWTINSVSGFPGNAHTGQMLITRGSGPTKGFTDTLVEFKNVPSGSWGCQFELDYQPGHGGYFSNQQGDAQRVNVFQITSEIPSAPTWQNVAPITGSQIGSFQFPTGDALNKPQKIVISNSGCAPTMRFRLSMNQESLGYIENNDDATSGLRISHNC